MAKLYFSGSYSKSLENIEDFIFEATNRVEEVEKFLDAHDRTLEFIAENPTTPAVHPNTGDQSWPFFDGRYRLFFVVNQTSNELLIYLVHIVDNRQANLELYPQNSLPTYEED